MRIPARALLVLLAAAAIAVPKGASAQSRFAVHVFGVSYHYQSRTYRDAFGVTRHYEQVNLGLGAEYVLSDGPRMVVTAEGGAYRDSKDRTNAFAGPAWRLKAGPHLQVGAGIVAMTSRTYGTPVAPLPLVTGRWTRASVNATWLPTLSREESGAIGFFATIHI